MLENGLILNKKPNAHQAFIYDQATKKLID